ncbi:uncharacterized protein K441DRAFT_680124 [Cenococcum geophilum 1.58]|uniref:uncharacterized protein n=1 Tax=Cenococcum geophilum 1.58 TaxID=794803 RepID=UPI00358F00B4|nr:hypothetical protein K441DRAFT_680124 [Cenococcum geophilum 1.58]
MSTPTAKRRRLDNATRTLHKPFKSPFRTPLKPQIAAEDSSKTANTPSTVDHSHVVPVQSTATPTKPLPTRPAVSTPSTRAKASTASTKPSTTSALISLRTDIQTLTQAYRLATSTTDADLEVLIERWRAASRAAAEELFASTRDRVNRMGGVGAWREREKEQREWRTKWEKEEMEAERGGRGEAEGEEEGEERREKSGEREYERGRDKDEQEEKVEEGNDDDSFTMDMMLRTLNIDIDVIGYDRQGQRWVG